MNGKLRGFTLIELMVVLAIVAIIMSIAIPAFTEQLAKSRRSDAISGLQSLALQMERWRADNPSFAGSGTDYPSQAQTKNYSFTVSGQTATGYTLTATKRGAQTNDRCGNFTYVYAAGTVTKSALEATCWNN